jgi:hypothetical protein
VFLGGYEIGDGVGEDSVEPGFRLRGDGDDGELSRRLIRWSSQVRMGRGAYLPDEDQTNNAHQEACDALLLAAPWPQTRRRASENFLTRMNGMRLIGERPGHVTRCHQPTAAKRILNSLNCLCILVAIHLRPAVLQSADKAGRRSSVGAEERHDHGRVNEDERVGDNDQGRSGRRLAGAEKVTTLATAILKARQVIASLEEQTGDNGKGGREGGEGVRDGN